MFNKNKALIVSLCLIVLLGMLAACSKATDQSPSTNKSAETGKSAETNQSGAAAAPQDRPFYSIKVMVRVLPEVKFEETGFGKIIKDKFNMTFDFIPYTGDYVEKLNLMLAAGDYPELLNIRNNDMVQKYIDANVLVPLDDYLEDAPNFAKMFEKYIPNWRISPDNKLYKWEANVPTDAVYYAKGLDIAVRMDALEQQGWPNLLSTDSYITFLKKALEQNPETNGQKTIGMTVAFAGNLMAWLPQVMFEKGGRYLASILNGVIFNDVTKEFEDLSTNEYVLESYQFFNKLYREGILDKESFTDTEDQVQEKLNSGRALSVWYSVYKTRTANPLLSKAGKPNMQYIRLPVRSDKQIERNEKRELFETDANAQGSVAITKEAKYPERIIELLNWISTDEAQTLMQNGEEGVYYTIVDGKKQPTDQYKAVLAKTEKDTFGLNGLSQVFPTYKTKDANGNYIDMLADPDVNDQLMLSAEERNAYKQLGWKNSYQYWLDTGVPQSVGLVYQVVIDPASELGAAEANIVQLRSKWTPRLIQAKNDEEFQSIWEQYLVEHEKLNPQKLVDEYNRLYAEKAKNQ